MIAYNRDFRHQWPHWQAFFMTYSLPGTIQPRKFFLPISLCKYSYQSNFTLFLQLCYYKIATVKNGENFESREFSTSSPYSPSMAKAMKMVHMTNYCHDYDKFSWSILCYSKHCISKIGKYGENFEVMVNFYNLPTPWRISKTFWRVKMVMTPPF
jgi:hypothetical protein